MHSEIARDHNHNNDYADDVKNIHGLAPILECAILEITYRYHRLNAAGVFSVPAIRMV